MYKPNPNGMRNGREKHEIREKSRCFFEVSVLRLLGVVMAFVDLIYVIRNLYCMS